MSRPDFRARYGPWAVVAGASEGLGAAFAHALAARGMNLALLARRESLLRSTAEAIRARHGVEVRSASVDLSRADALEPVRALTAGLEVGLYVHNAAFAPLGAFLDQPVEALHRALDVNCRAAVDFTHHFLPPMVSRRRGGVVLMSSLTAFQGSPWVSTYGATKSFLLALGEGLWMELSGTGVDVLACCAGAIRTPNLLKTEVRDAPGALEPQEVAEEALRALGRKPTHIPGRFNRFASFVMRRLLPRKASVRVIGSHTRRLQLPP